MKLLYFLVPLIMSYTPDCYRNKNGINPVPGDCTKFYLCANGTPFAIQTCGAGTFFNGEICTWKNQANCNAEWRTTTTTTRGKKTSISGNTKVAQLVLVQIKCHEK